MRTVPRLFALSLAIVLVGCATADFTPYVGAQQTWPTATGAFVRTVGGADGHYVLPVYFGPPNRSYRVIGYIDAESANLAIWESGKTESLKPAVKAAKQHGADALIIVTQGVESRGSVTSSFGQSNSNTATTGNVFGGVFNANSQTTTTGFGSALTTSLRRGKVRAIAIKFL